MIGVVVVSKFITNDTDKNFSGMIDYMDRNEAIKNEYMSISIKNIELDSIEKKLLSVINKTGNTNINELLKDEKLKNLICYEKGLFNKKNKLTRYDSNYLMKKFFDKNGQVSDADIDKILKKSIRDKKQFEEEKKRIKSRLKKLNELDYIIKEDDKYRLTEKAKLEMKGFSEFGFTSFDVNKILPLVRESKHLTTIQAKLLNKYDMNTKEGKNDYMYLMKRINNNIENGYLSFNNGKLEVTKKGLLEEDKIKNPHRQFLEEKLHRLERNEEFKRGKSIMNEHYSIEEGLDYSGMIDYMDREKAKKVNSKENIGLFTQDKDNLDSKEKFRLKKLFNQAQKNHGIMWHDVISFDNKFLEKHGIYDSKNNVIDDRKLKKVVRSAVNEMLKKENLDKSAVWCGDIHYNTDNIHIHVSTVELNPSTDRGKRKPKSIFAMKSGIVNGIVNNAEQYKKINEIIRKDIIESKKNVNFLKDRELKKLFLQVHKNLPADRRQWYYNYNTLNDVRPLIDKMTETYIDKYEKDSLSKLKCELEKQEKNLKEAYGDGKNSFYKNYSENKMNDLKTRMGNSILKEMREYDYNLTRNRTSNKKKFNRENRSKSLKGSIVSFRLKEIERAVINDYEHFKNQQHYKRLEEEIEKEV